MIIVVRKCNDLNECNKLEKNKDYFNEIITAANFMDFDMSLESLIQKNEEGLVFGITSENIETSDGVDWSTRRYFTLNGLYLSMCYVYNELNSAQTFKIIFPTEIETGRMSGYKEVFERTNDNQVVEGDDFSLQFLFNNIIFNPKLYTLTTKPSSETCGIDTIKKNFTSNEVDVYDKTNTFEYTHLIEMRFKNVKSECKFDYKLRLTLSSYPNFDPKTKPVINTAINYTLNVTKPLKPFFLDTKTNKTVIVSNVTIDNSTEFESVVITYSDIKVDADKTVVLNCLTSGRPKPIVVWLKDNKELNKTDEKYTIDDGSLKIFRTHPIDSGKYECNSSNRYGYLTRSFNVQVDSITQTIKIKELTRRQIVVITLISFAVFVLLVLLICTMTYVFYQKREHEKLSVN